MAIIKKTDIIDKGAENALDPLIAKQKVLIEQENQLIKNSIAWQKALVDIKKTQDGSEAQKLINANNQLIKTSKNLSNVEKERIRNGEQLEKTFAKVLVSREKNALSLAKGKVRLQENNKLLKQQAKEALGLSGAYDKLSAELNDTRKAYKNLAAAGKANTKEAKNQLAAIQKLDKKLKDIDNSVGQNQRSVGKYTNALKGLGGQLLGALGVVGGLNALVSAFQAVGKRALELGSITRKVQSQFKVTNKEAKALSSTILALANNFDEDYNEILKSATAVSKEFGISAEKSLALIEEGFKKGSNNSGEFLDILREYPVQLKSIGLSADESFAVINQQVKQGVYSDKGIDALKEAGIRLRENTKAVKQSLSVFDEDTRAQIDNAVARGEVFEATQLISKGIKENGLTAQETQEIISNVFGGAGEDAQSFVLALDDVNLSLDDVANQTSIVEDASLGLSKAWNNFVGDVEDGTGFISRAWASLQTAATNLLQQLTALSQGSARASDAQKKAAGFYVELNKQFEKYSGIIDNVEAGEKRLLKARKLAQTARANQIVLQNKVNKLIKDGASLTNADVIALQVQADLYGDLSQKIKDEYIPAKVKENEEDTKSNFTKSTLTKNINSQTEAQKKLNDELERQRLIAERSSVTAPEALPNQSSTPGFGIDDGSELVDFDAANKEKEALEEIKIEEAKQNALQDIRNTALTETAQFASDVFSQEQDSKLARILSDVEAEKQIAKQRFEEGIINQEQYNNRIASLNKKARQAEAKAEKKKALFDIAINTAVAVVKALASAAPPINFINAAKVAIAGGIQAGLVAAKPPPAFKDGVIGFEGKGSTTSDSNQVLISNKESVITAKGTENAPLTLDAINRGLISDGDLNVSHQIKKDNSQQILSNKLDKLNNTNDQMLTAMLNGASEFTIGGWRYVKYANGETIKTKVQ